MNQKIKRRSEEKTQAVFQKWLNEVKKKHGNKYDYSKVVYTDCYNPVVIGCDIHGEFLQTPSYHRTHYGCPECRKESLRVKLSEGELAENRNNDFIRKSKEVHGEGKFDYSECKFITVAKKVKLICKTCNHTFEQQAGSHLRGCSCPKCSHTWETTTEEYIEKLKNAWGDTYKYEKVVYLGSYKDVTLTCPQHGDFTKKAYKALIRGCPKCAGYNLTTEDFIKSAKEYWGNQYNLSEAIYVDSSTKIKIICEEHGPFWVTYRHFIKGRGCPNCNESKGERAVRQFLKKNNIEFTTQETFSTNSVYPICKNPVTDTALKFDFYLPKFNLACEYQGRQHTIPWSFTTGATEEDKIKNLADLKFRDGIKVQYCFENDISLLCIDYKDFDKIDKILTKELGLKNDDSKQELL